MSAFTYTAAEWAAIQQAHKRPAFLATPTTDLRSDR